jgi:hypothetical protein
MINDDDIKVNIYTPTSTRRLINSTEEEKNTPVIPFISIFLQQPFDAFQEENNNYSVNTNSIIRDILQRSFNNTEELKRNDNIIPTLKLKKLDKIKDKICDECVICKNQFSQDHQDETVALLKCKHYFHEDCINNWCKYKQECPLCKKQIPYTTKED